MKRKWYRGSGAKFFLILFVTVSMTAAGICGICALGLMTGYGICPFDSRDYIASQSFDYNLLDRSYEILEAIRDSAILDEGDGEDLIDLVGFQQNEDIINENACGIAYRAEDLYEWSQTNWGNEVNVLICTEPDGMEHYIYYDDFAELVNKGELNFVYSKDAEYEGLTVSSVLAGLDEGFYACDPEYSEDEDTGIRSSGVESIEDANGNTVYLNVRNYYQAGEDDVAIQEKYKPDGADSILDILNSDKMWNGNINKAYQLLNDTLWKYSEAAQAESLLEKYAAGNSNLMYLYADEKSGKMYSNMNVSDYRAGLQKITSGDDPYILIAPKLQDCETNLENIEAQTITDRQQMTESAGLFREDYIYVTAVDKNFAVTDALADAKIHYEKYDSWLAPMLGVSAGMLFLTLIGMFLLTCGAGRSLEDEKVHLNFLDRVWTEAAALAVGCIWVCGLAIPLEFSESLFDGPSLFHLAVITGVSAVWTMIWFLTGWLSLVRRIKAKTLWKNSCCGFILHWTGIFLSKGVEFIKLLSGNMVGRLKMILAFAVFIALQLIFSAGFFDGGAPFFLLLILAADWIALYYLLKRAWGREQIIEGLKKITDGELQYKIPTEKLSGEEKIIAEYINHIGEGLDAAVENSLKNERMKTELITNVSHDIKTPLTSIINYIDLLKREDPQDPKIRGYLEVLENKAQRLKVLTEDVVEASKASTGNIALEITKLNFVEMINQLSGEFEERFQEKNLTLLFHSDQEEVMICADGRRLWRVLENLFGNVSKYAMENTRVYADLKTADDRAVFSLKNISAQPLNISVEELTERFIRGDVSRNTEGSGLGLSIAKDLTELQGGELTLYLDGDLFKATVEFRTV